MAENHKYIPTIGLEIHAELRTASKMFCSCKNDPDEMKPNVNICPICMGHPGTLPVLNKEAIKHVLKIGHAVGGKIADFTEWDGKNYFYPDIPKGYQISQYAYPLVTGGKITGVEIERIHLEEDTASSTHDQHEKSLIDFNRSGVPLMELVTKPVIHDALTAVAFARDLQLLLRCLGAGEANMEKGEMRIEANISLASAEDTAARKFGTKTEVKNLNSFRSVERAIAYEIERQIEILERAAEAASRGEQATEKVVQETRGWNDAKQETYSQRIKESSHDYRYFPDPDIPKMKISEIAEFAEKALRSELPELPWEKRERYKKDFGVTEKESDMLVENELLSAYLDKTAAIVGKDPKKSRLLINYLLTDYVALIRAKFESAKSDTANKSGSQSDLEHVSPSQFAELIDMIAKAELSSAGAKRLLALLVDSNDITASAKTIAEKNDLIQKSNAADIAPAIEKVIADNAKAVAEYKAGKTASIQFLIGQAMKATRGAANPEVVKKLLVEKIG